MTRTKVTYNLIDGAPVNPTDYGAVGDGVTDDSAAFKLVEAATGDVVELGGKTFALIGIWTDAVNGVRLTKNYRNGALLIDGRALTFDSSANFAASGAASGKNIIAPSGKRLGIFREDENNYYVWRPLGGQFWQRNHVTRASNTLPLNWNEIYIKQVFGYIAAEDSGVAYTGASWFQLSSASATSYISGRARQASTVSDYVEITYTGKGDLYVVYTGRTSGNYVNVLLNGDDEYLVLPDDGAGNKYFDSYTATDLDYKRRVKIAEGVPQGTHTIRLTLSATKNASSTGDKFIFNALAYDNDDIGPWTTETDAPLWVTGEAVLQHQVRKNSEGNYYYAAAGGTTGATEPTHTSGTVSDGAVDWTYRADSGYTLLDHRLQAAGSQLEYAYEIKPTGASAKEDVGGALHGNETQDALRIYAGNVQATIADNEWRQGDNIAIVEEISGTHSEIGGGSTQVMDTLLVRNFSKEGVRVKHRHELQLDAEFGYFYAHMWPLLHYSSIGEKYGVLELWSSGDGRRASSDFYSVSNPFVGRTKDLTIIGYGDAMQPDGDGAGNPTAVAAPLEFVAYLSVNPESVDNYEDAGSIFASKAMNTSGADVSSGGFSSMVSKIYFERYAAISPVSKSSGYVIECEALYGLGLRAK